MQNNMAGSANKQNYLQHMQTLNTTNNTSPRAVASPLPRVHNVTPKSDDEHHLAGTHPTPEYEGTPLVNPGKRQPPSPSIVGKRHT